MENYPVKIPITDQKDIDFLKRYRQDVEFMAVDDQTCVSYLDTKIFEAIFEKTFGVACPDGESWSIEILDMVDSAINFEIKENGVRKMSENTDKKALSFHEKISAIQTAVKVSKEHFNSFGKYNFRNAEDIMSAVKPLLDEYGLILTCSETIESVVSDSHLSSFVETTNTVIESAYDETAKKMVEVKKTTEIKKEPIIELVSSSRVYVVCTACISDGEQKLENKSIAREPAVKKGMDESQITGATTSYARKYALAGLLLLDDGKDDPDSIQETSHTSQAKAPTKSETTPKAPVEKQESKKSTPTNEMDVREFVAMLDKNKFMDAIHDEKRLAGAYTVIRNYFITNMPTIPVAPKPSIEAATKLYNDLQKRINPVQEKEYDPLDESLDYVAVVNPITDESIIAKINEIEENFEQLGGTLPESFVKYLSNQYQEAYQTAHAKDISLIDLIEAVKNAIGE